MQREVPQVQANLPDANHGIGEGKFEDASHEAHINKASTAGGMDMLQPHAWRLHPWHTRSFRPPVLTLER